MPKQQQYFFEVTDTFAGETNYAWVHRYLVRAKSLLGALRKVARETGYSGRLKKTLDCGDFARWDVRGAAICILGNWTEGREAQTYQHVKTLP